MRNPSSSRILLVLFALFAVTWTGCSVDREDGPVAPTASRPFAEKGIPAGYYDTVDGSNPAALRASLHEVIDDHQRYPYTSTATDTWDVLETADEDPADSGRILDLYMNASYPKYGEGNTDYNREHSWPNSYGFPDDNSTNYPYTDCHALFLCNDSYNSSRGNKPYRTCDAACDEKPTEYNNGAGGGTGVYPGNSNWTTGAYTEGTWETWIGRRGDVARALLYLDVRYEGGTHGGTGVAEPDLILTDEEALIAASNTGSNESVAYMGMLTVLLQWHQQDPVDDLERARNDAVYSYQGNRNPFIDHPEWVDCVFGGSCGGGDTTPPAAPTGLVATGGDGLVTLDWDDNGEGDLAGYQVYRAGSSGGPYAPVSGLETSSEYTDTGVVNGTTYWYVVTALDTSDNESGDSGEASATPAGGVQPPAAVWINELHYDNEGADKGEFLEIAGPAGTDLASWQVLGYNGADGGVYDTVSLSGTLPDQQNGYGTASFAMRGMQNGSPDGLALVDGTGQVVEFLSYEGTFTAIGGAADGMTATDIGVAENGADPKGWSLQRTGAGTASSDFAWQPPMADTPGQPNTGQTFLGEPDTTPPAAPAGLAAAAGDGAVSLDWDDNGEGDLDGYNVHRATTSGGPYTQLNGGPVAASAYTDDAAVNGTTYWYVVTAVDLSANESGPSNEASATPEAGSGVAAHVASIVTGTVAVSKFERAEATVTVVDAGGAPVAGATVTGTFSGDVAETASAVTGPGGVAVLTTLGKDKAPIAFTFCVDDITGSGITYDPGANVVTCATR